MKRFSLLAAALMVGASLFGAKKAPMVTNVEPPYWWVGMANDTLQVMLTGPDIAQASAEVDYSGVKLDRQVSLDSPNYKLLYFTIAPDAKPGKMPIRLNFNGRKHTLDYELKARDMKGEDYEGFSAADVLYLLMPDRFAQGDVAAATDLEYDDAPDRTQPSSRHGGNLKGIADKLDYLDSLGITAIWSCPVLENDMPGGSYHGYATTDYYRIDPRFGTNADWQELIAQAHKRGIKVVMDMIFNHSGSNHPWMKDMPSKDWYNHPEGNELTNFRLSTIHDPYVSDYDLDHTVNGWFVSAMPDLNQKNPHLMKYLIQNSIWWIEEAGIDGIRMDTYPYADKKEMAKWVDAVMKEYPQFNIVGECWFADPALEQYWQKGSPVSADDSRLPTVMDFALMLKSQKLKPYKEQTNGWQGLNDIYSHLAMDYIYADPMKVLRFLDNHDTDRLLDSVPSDLGPWKQAMTLLLTAPGIPQIYYGTELLMSGTREGGDGNVRKDMPGGFPGDTGNVFTAEGRSQLQNEAYDFLSKILKWRKGSEAIAKGDMKHFATDNGIYLFRRKYGDKEAIVVLNGRDEANSADMSRYAEITDPGRRYRDVISGETVTLLNPENPAIEFSPRQIMILEPEK